MSRIVEVLKSKNLSERSQRARRKEEVERLRGNVAFRANLNEYLKQIDVLLESDEVDSITVVVQDNYISKFQEAMFSDIMSGYDVRQHYDKPNTFTISYKEI